MKQKRFVAYFSHTQIIGFTKDGVLLPLYLAKLLDMPGTFYYGYNIGELPVPNEVHTITLKGSYCIPTIFRYDTSYSLACTIYRQYISDT